MSRAREMRSARRAAQFAKFRITELNLVPLVDTFVSIVFFALTTSTVGELAPVVAGVSLPESRVGAVAHQQLTLGIGRQITLGEDAIMNTVDAARAQSNDPSQPLLIPGLYNRLRQKADSIRRDKDLEANQSIDVPLAVQGDKTMRYDLLARVMQTARLAGFRSISLQVHKTQEQAQEATQASR
jgi:biopolymer transport protein ExbD